MKKSEGVMKGRGRAKLLLVSRERERENTTKPCKFGKQTSVYKTLHTVHVALW